MDLTTTFIVLQTGWDVFCLMLLAIALSLVVGMTIVFFQDKMF